MNNPNAVSANTLHSFSGKFEATFSSESGSETVRHPYSSQTIHSLLASNPEVLDFESRSGTSSVHSIITTDHRIIRIIMRSDIASGTYSFPENDAVIKVEYGEYGKVGTGFYFQSHKATKAILDLKITNQGRSYSGTLEFEVLINGETIKIDSSFEVRLNLSNSAKDQYRATSAYTPTLNTQNENLQNITGDFQATFPASTNPGETSFTRAPYRSSEFYYMLPPLTNNINFHSSSGSQKPDTYTVRDGRTFTIELKQGITSGIYTFPSAGGQIIRLEYGEIRKMGDNYRLTNLEIVEAKLDLEVTDGRHYASKDLFITAKTTTGTPFFIKANFDIHLALD